MDWKAVLYVGTTALMFAIFVAIVVHTYKKGRKKSGEEAKYRMMDDDDDDD